MDYLKYLPLILILVLSIPFLVLLRQFVFTYINLKEKEIQLLTIQSGGENKLQAYERMTLFLERIKPSNLVTKFHENLTAAEFVFLSEKAIMEEFDYNMSQQLYFSQDSWQSVTYCKTEIIKTLRNTYQTLNDNANLEEYKTVFLMNYMSETDYITDTIEFLKSEAFIYTLKK